MIKARTAGNVRTKIAIAYGDEVLVRKLCVQKWKSCDAVWENVLSRVSHLVHIQYSSLRVAMTEARLLWIGIRISEC